MKYLLLLLSISACFADNTDLFNQTYQFGKQNQFNLNLNTNSTINSYGKANYFESNVANNANTGNANSQSMYNNTYGENANPNYLYNEGTKDIAACQSKDDPRCSTLNKYGDKDTQAQFQAYSQGISAKYYISVKPDPADSSCSTITRKVPINQSLASCIASSHTQTTCNSTIAISLDSHDCDPSTGGCNLYQNNPMCQLTRPYITAKCTGYSYQFNYGGCSVGTSSCNVPSTFNTPGCDGSHGRTYTCGGCSSGGDAGDHNGCWNQKCSNWTPGQLASYACKVYRYGDGCSGFKK